MPGPGVEFGGVIDEGAIAARWEGMSSTLDERGRRRWCASEARSHGRGGIAAVARVTGISRRTVDRGLRELELELGREEEPLAAGRGPRLVGGGGSGSRGGGGGRSRGRRVGCVGPAGGPSRWRRAIRR